MSVSEVRNNNLHPKSVEFIIDELQIMRNGGFQCKRASIKLTSKKAPLGRQKWYANGFCHDAVFADASKIEGIEGNRPLREGEIRWNLATIACVKFLPTTSRVLSSLSGVTVFTIGLVRKGIVDFSWICIFSTSFQILAPTVRIPFFKCIGQLNRYTHT